MSTTINPTTSNQQAPVKLTPDAADIFRKAVKQILNNWPSFDLALDNGCGGPQSNEKRIWMINTLTEDMIKGKDVDVQYYLDEILDNEFDTVIEDGSLEYNANWIEKFYKDCLSGKEQDVLYSITQASLKRMSLDRVIIPEPVCQTKPEDESETEDEEDF